MKNVFLLFALFLVVACTQNKAELAHDGAANTHVFKGLYSYGPEIRTFVDCSSDINFWVVDSSKNLELSYSNFNFEKPYEPVYIEVEGYLTAVDTAVAQSDFDSTLVVTKLKLITKDIPDGPCSGN